MSTHALKTQGVTIKRGNDNSPLTYTLIAEVTDFDGPGGQASEIDVTSLDSTAKEFLLGLRDEGDFSFTCNLVPGDTGQAGLRSDRDYATLQDFQITLTNTPATTLTFQAYVKEFRIKGGLDDKISASVTLRISGPVAWA